MRKRSFRGHFHSEWPSNDKLVIPLSFPNDSEWRNDPGMRVIKVDGLKNVPQSTISSVIPPPVQSFHKNDNRMTKWSSSPCLPIILGMILEWQNDNCMTEISRSPCLSIILWMILEWQNDNRMTKWSSSPCLPIILGLILEWQNDNWMTKNK